MTAALLTLAAVAAGMTGAWSPCSLSAAETLRGTRLLVDDEQADEDEEEGWREEDLLGFDVVLVDGTPLGSVSALHLRPVQDLLAVRTPRGEVLVPFVEELVPEVDEDARRIVVDPPPGLVELAEES